MKNVFLIVKKELDKIFKFPRMIVSTILLPGLLIFIMYGIMGITQSQTEKNVEAHKSIVYVVNESELLVSTLNQIGNIEIKTCTNDEISEIKESIKKKTADTLVILDDNFDEKTITKLKPNVEIFYSAVDSNSVEAYQKVVMAFEAIRNSILASESIDTEYIIINSEKVNTAGEETGQVLAILLPMLLIIMIFSSAMGIGSEAIAGEKERGTLSTILMTPIKREEYLTGKLLSTVILTLLSATSSFIGIIASMPLNDQMFGVSDISTLAYGFGDYMMLLGTLIVIALFASILLITASTIAKSIKEATSYGLPVYIVAMLCAIIPVFSEAKVGIIYYCIPIYNCSIVVKDILTMSIDPMNFLAMVISSLVIIAIIVVFLRKLFKKENIIFGR